MAESKQKNKLRITRERNKEREGHITKPRTVHDNTWYCSKTCISRRAQPLPPCPLSLSHPCIVFQGGELAAITQNGKHRLVHFGEPACNKQDIRFTYFAAIPHKWKLLWAGTTFALTPRHLRDGSFRFAGTLLKLMKAVTGLNTTGACLFACTLLLTTLLFNSYVYLSCMLEWWK